MKKALLLAFVSMFALQANASTPELIDAVKNNNVSRVLELLNNQENPNGLNEQGNTALHYAVALDNADMTQILLSYGADLNVKNLKGWTPLKIAEKKDLKRVTPVLVQYLHLQKQNRVPTAEVVAEVNEVVQQIPQNAANEVAEVPEIAVAKMAEVKEVVEQVPAETDQAPAPEVVITEVKEVAEQLPQQASVENVQAPEVVVTEVKEAEVVEEVPEASRNTQVPEQQPQEAGNDVEVPTITESQFKSVLNEASAEIAKERYAKEQAEQKVIALQNELMKTKAEKEDLAKSLESITKDNAKKEDVAKVETNEPAKAADKKPAPKPVKPVLKKKPVYRAPQPIVKKVVLTPSTMVDGIYAGDEEIVYCLDYLGNGENESMKRAAGYFAASVSISEARYKQIVDKANDFFMKASAEDMTKRDGECSKIVTPKDKSKQNQIVRSMNKSVGY